MPSRAKYQLNPQNVSDRTAIMWKEDFYLAPKVKTSLWLWIAVASLLISNVLFFVSFVTNGWGRLNYDAVEFDRSTGENRTEEYKLEFGLWAACRTPDTLCSSEIPAFYGAVRAFAVLSLFGHVFAVSLLIGHVLEKLLDYDPCGLGAITAVCFSTSVFLIIAVSVFGALWPREYRGSEFKNVTLTYSFIICCVIIIFPFIAGVMCVIEIRQSLVRLEHETLEALREEYHTATPSTSHKT